MRMARIARSSALVCGLASFGLMAGCWATSEESKSAASAPVAVPSGKSTPQSEDAAPPPEKTGGFDGQKAFEHVRNLVAIGPRPPASPGIHKAQEYIQSQLQSFGCKWEEDDFSASTPIGNVRMKNILVKIPGASPNVILLSTHYDTLLMENFVGADDSGSSTALMLELARLLCPSKGALSIWIAFFDAEEAFVNWDTNNDNTYGSREMAAKLAASGDLKRIKAMMLADLIGGRNLHVKRETNSTGWLTDLVWKTAARLGYGDVFLSQEFAVNDDHLSFLKRKVPCVDVIDLDGSDVPYWHTPQDTLDKISARSLAIVGHVFVESVRELEKRETKH